MLELIDRYKWSLIILAALTLVGIRFSLVATSPNGFYIDEVATGAHVQHMLDSGTDYHGNAWPLMSRSLGGGYTTAVYLYPLVAWASLFEAGEVSLRLFSQFVGVLAVTLLAYGVYLLRGKRTATMALFTGLLLPWSWVGGNLAWDPAITPLFISAAIVCFAALRRFDQLKHWQTHALLAGLTLSLVLAAYSYPPARVAAPLLLIAALTYLWRYKITSPVSLFTPLAVGALSSLPLIIFTLSPEALDRSAALHVFRNGIGRGVLDFTVNILRLLDPRALFIDDTSNLRHTAGRYGALGPVALIGLASLLWRLIKHPVGRGTREVIAIALVGSFIGLVGSALTTEGQPHYLRAVVAWPFIVILAAVGWEYLWRAGKYRAYTAAAGLVAAGMLIVHMSITYPSSSGPAFNSRQNPGQHGGVVDMYYHD